MNKNRLTVISKATTILVKNQEPKLSHIVFVKDKTHFLTNLPGRVTNFLFLALQKLEWNNNVILFGGEVKTDMRKRLDISGASFSNCLGLLCANGIFRKIGNCVYEYNPHLFYYADESVVSKWRKRWDCDFDDDKCEIKVKIIQDEK